MNFDQMLKRIKPLVMKLTGRLPLAPWQMVFAPLHPGTLGVFPPPARMDIVAQDTAMKMIRFGNERSFWFPEKTEVGPELWSEYLCVFWNHRTNGHYYFRAGTDIREGDICIDLGACEGFFVKAALEKGAAIVVCIEPFHSVAACLSRTFEREIAQGRVLLVEAGAGAINSRATFASDDSQPFGGTFGGSGGEEVRIAKLDTLVRDLKLSRVDYIKLDIEGAEIGALEGAMETLRSYHPKVAMAAYHRVFDYRAAESLLFACGYRHIASAGVAYRDPEPGIPRPTLMHACE